MTENTQLLGELEKLLAWKKSKGFMAEKLGISVEEVGQLLAELRGTKTIVEEAETGNYIAELEDRIVKYNEDRGTLESSVISSFEPKSHEELATLHRVDLTKYKISSYWTKQRGDKFTSSLLCTSIKPEDFSAEKFAEFLSTYEPKYGPIITVTGTAEDREWVDVELSIADFHLDKLTVQPEPIEERVEQYKRAVKDLINKTTAVYAIDTIAFIISNDFFHTDNYNNQTTRGTSLDVSTTWNKAYEIGFDLLVWAISYLESSCKTVEVILVAGNHDRTKSFYLAHALEVYFKGNENIWFDRGFDTIKYTVLGKTFIGYHHGDCKLDDLPLIFATDKDSGQEFGASSYREVHTGDKHYYMVKEIKGVRVQQLPSLSGTDRWHKDNNFVNNVRSALALIYHPEKGKCAEFEHRL